MACGAGVQFLADRYPVKPVFPALNTVFVGVDRDIGWFEENCRTCRECVLGETGGICPVTRCARVSSTAPVEEPLEGKCEVSKDTPCAWFEIHKRLKEQNRLEKHSAETCKGMAKSKLRNPGPGSLSRKDMQNERGY
jgi:hypothetical protein